MSRKHVLVIGDTIIDEYIIGSVDRISPEAPVPVLDYKDSYSRLGGAANVACNIRSLASDPNIKIKYLGAVSTNISDMLALKGISIQNINATEDQILYKTRFVCNNKHLLRVDTNKSYDKIINDSVKSSIVDLSFEKIKYDLVVLSDYNKKTIDPGLIADVLRLDAPILFDFKSADTLLPIQHNAYIQKIIFKCNKKEFDTEFCRLEPNWISPSIAFEEQFNLVVTLGEDGFRHMGKTWPSERVEARDVVGAGDTFLAGMAVRYLKTGNLDVLDMAKFANVCATEKVRHFGTYAVSAGDLNDDSGV